MGIFKGFTDFLDEIFSGNFKTAFSGLQEIFSNIGNLLQHFVNDFKTKFPETFDFASGIFNSFKDLIIANIENVKGVLEGFKDFFTGIFTGDFEKAFSVIEKIVGGICSVLESLIFPIQDKLYHGSPIQDITK